MGIGLDTIKQLDAVVAGDVNARAEMADAKNRLDAWLYAYDTGEGAAQKAFAESKPAEFAAVRAAEVAKSLAKIDEPLKAEAEVAAVVEAVAKI